MIFAIYEEDLENTTRKRMCYGIQDETGRIYPCIPYERCQIEELVALLNRSDISEEHIEEVVQDFEGYWIYKHMGIW